MLDIVIQWCQLPRAWCVLRIILVDPTSRLTSSRRCSIASCTGEGKRKGRTEGGKERGKEEGMDGGRQGEREGGIRERGWEGEGSL